MKVLKPSIDELQPLLEEATKGQTMAEWIPKILNSIKKVLIKDPLRYRSYGPYWPLVKKAMIDAGIKDFGTEIDADWFTDMDYGNTGTNLLAAFGYEDTRFNLGLMVDPFHLMEVNEEGETFEYASGDEILEAMAVAQKLR